MSYSRHKEDLAGEKQRINCAQLNLKETPTVMLSSEKLCASALWDSLTAVLK